MQSRVNSCGTVIRLICADKFMCLVYGRAGTAAYVKGVAQVPLEDDRASADAAARSPGVDALHIESIEVGRGAGGEHEAVCGAVEESEAVQVGDGVQDFHLPTDCTDQFVG